jgi:hypothetical protein
MKKLRFSVFDIDGRVVETKDNLMPGSNIRALIKITGRVFILIEVIRASERKALKLIQTIGLTIKSPFDPAK